MAAFGTFRATATELQATRQQPHPLTGLPLPPGSFRHSDEQSVAALMAVWRAVGDYGLGGTDFGQWGVLAAPRFVGRATMAGAVEKFAAEGAWGISPHLIPHRSLHSVSGTISQVLRIHGPNFGIGGGPGSASEAVLAVPALLDYEGLPGVWLVLTGWSREPAPRRGLPPEHPGECRAVAFALRPASAARGPYRLCVRPGASVDSPADGVWVVDALHDALATGGPAAESAWRLEGGGQIRLERRAPQTQRRAG